MPTPTGFSPSTQVVVPGNVQMDALVNMGSIGSAFGVKWGGALGTGVSLSYSFPTLGSSWSHDPDTGYGHGGYPADINPEPLGPQYGGLNAAQQDAVRISLASWSHVANIGFTEVADNASVVGDIRVAVTGGGFMDSSTYAYTYTPDAAAYAGDVWLNAVQPVSTGNDYSLGANGYATILHELGHAVGLNHSFSLDGTADALPAQFESFKYSIMSYSDRPGHQDSGFSSYYPTTPMLMDIQALQYLYGANTSWAAGNDLYTFNQGSNYYQTIWDAGGNDTIQYNASTDGALIDLIAGHFSQLGNGLTLSDGMPQDDDVAIAFNVTIENAIGGGGNDVLIGNDVANTLAGGAGNDSIVGGLGDDNINGNNGVDTVDGGDGNDTLHGGQNEDLLRGGNGNDVVMGDVGNDRVFGDLGDDTLTGGAGTDTLDGGIGLDTADYRLALGATVVDLTLGTAASDGWGFSDVLVLIEKVAGSAFNDTLGGDLNANVLDGGAGDDSMLGQGGNDLVKGGLGNDVLHGNTGADTVMGDDGNDQLLGDNGNDSILGGLGDDNINGNNGFDTVDGGAGNDTLHGGTEFDVLSGGDGNDQVFGDKGDDTVAGGAGNDTLSGGIGVDVFRYDAVSLGTGDVTANAQDVISDGVGELLSLLGLNDELAIGGTALNALSSDAVVGNALSAGTSIAFVGGPGGVLQVDVNLDGVFNAVDDFQITLTGVTTVTYNATDDLFHLA